MHNTRYIYTFVFIMTAIVALVLALLFNALKPIHEQNEAIYNKKSILSAVETKLGVVAASMKDEDVQAVFDNNIEQIPLDTKGNILDAAKLSSMADGATKAEEIDMAKQKKKDPSTRALPLYVYTADDGKKYYILSVRGNGLWDAIWGVIALEDDFKTIAGVSFDHQAETPGLGAEIKDNKGWKNQYIGKSIYDAAGNYTSVTAIKGGAKNPEYEVDGISGATITANGVNDMMRDGIKLYQPYLNKLKQS